MRDSLRSDCLDDNGSDEFGRTHGQRWAAEAGDRGSEWVGRGRAVRTQATRPQPGGRLRRTRLAAVQTVQNGERPAVHLHRRPGLATGGLQGEGPRPWPTPAPGGAPGRAGPLDTRRAGGADTLDAT